MREREETPPLVAAAQALDGERSRSATSLTSQKRAALVVRWLQDIYEGVMRER